MPKDKIDKYLEAISKYKSQIGKQPKRPIDQLAARNNLKEAYAMYKIHCQDTHSSLSSIGKVIDVLPKGIYLNGDFRFDDFSFHIKMLLSFTMLPFPTLIEKQLLNNSIESKYNLLTQRLESLC